MATLAVIMAAGSLWLGFTTDLHVGSSNCSNGEPHRRVELVFGLSRKGRPDVSDEEWRLFLDREVTPRFPDGLTVISGQGQWRSPSGVAVNEPSRLLLVWTKPAPDLGQRIELIRAAWKQAHQQESVVRAESASCVAF